MTEETKNKILNTISEIQALDIQECLSKNLDKGESLEGIEIWNFNGVTIIPVINRALKCLKDFLSRDEYKFHVDLPFEKIFPQERQLNYNTFRYTFPRQTKLGQKELSENVENLLSAIQKRDIELLEKSLKTIISYAIVHRFWGRDSKTSKSDILKIEQEKEEIAILRKDIDQQLRSLIAQTQELNEKVSERLDSLNSLVAEKKSEFENISSNKNNSDDELERIREVLEEAKKLVADQDRTFTEVFARIKQKESDLDDYSDDLESSQQTVKTQIEIFDKHNKDIQGQKEEIEKYKNETAELVALISSAGLAGSFKQRAQALNDNVEWWRWGIVGGFVLCGAWLAVAFIWLPNFVKDGTLQDIYSSLLFVGASIAKIFPVYLVMSFIFKQYTRERKIQEMYEFKAAVSATLNTVADQLVAKKHGLTVDDFASEDGLNEEEWKKYVDERDKYRRELIQSTVTGLYKEIDLEEKHTELINEKNLSLINKLFETVKSLKS